MAGAVRIVVALFYLPALIICPLSHEDSVLNLIEEAFSSYNFQLTPPLDEPALWLLEQALFISTETDDEKGWDFVAERSIDLLFSLHKVEDREVGQDRRPAVDQLHADNCLRCARIFSRCLQDMKKSPRGPCYL